jgi:hypothetical protein
MHKLGGVPPVPLPSLASAVSLDGHVDYVPYVAQLCARLMQLGHNAAAASTIQAWCVKGPGHYACGLCEWGARALGQTCACL